MGFVKVYPPDSEIYLVTSAIHLLKKLGPDFCFMDDKIINEIFFFFTFPNKIQFQQVGYMVQEHITKLRWTNK